MNNAIAECLNEQLQSLRNVLQALPDEAFIQPSVYLANATIGQHSRHAIELIQCLQQGYEIGKVNYDRRRRNILLETNRSILIAAIESCMAFCEKEDKQLDLEVVNHIGDNALLVGSTYFRELAYNLEHLIHHMALMNVAFKEFNIQHIPADFGVAYSTLQYRQACAQ
jgi:hypothetical protein